MKYIVVLLVGIALGLYIARYQLHLPAVSTFPSSEPAPAARSGFDEKMRQWRLTPDDIKQDLARTGEVVRNQADAVGVKIADARIVAVVKAKYILDRDLSAYDLHVSVNEGRVALSGSVATPDLLGRAVALALDTDGVAGVDSKLAIAPN